MTLKTFLRGDWTFTVFNDAKEFADYSNLGDVGVRRRIADTCARLNIPCIPLQNQYHQHITCAATRCYHAMQNTLNYQRQGGSNVGSRVLGLDSDMFLMRMLDAQELYAGYTAAVVPQHRRNDGGKEVRYFWNGLYYFDYSRIGARATEMDWRCNDVAGVWTDVGGGMHTFLGMLSESEVYRIPHKASGTWGFTDFLFDAGTAWLPFCMSDPRNTGTSFYSEIYDGQFLHFRGGGNWEKRPEYKVATGLLWDTVISVCKR